MGQMGSKTFQELHDADEVSATGTPKRCVVLSADPRSPSVGLDRTPITVAAPSTLKQQQTPVSASSSATLHDPRSPSTEIDRTPIYSSRPEITEEKKESSLAAQMPTRHLFNDYETLSNENESLMQEDNEENQESISDAEEDDVQLLQFHTPMKEPNSGIDDLIGHADLSPFVARMSDDLVDKLASEDDDVGTELAQMSNKLTLSDSVEQKNKVSKIPVSKTRKSPVNTNSKSDVAPPRSPLAPRNVDSETPKALIQRKQMRNIAMQVKNQNCSSQISSSGFPRSLQLAHDKENM